MNIIRSAQRGAHGEARHGSVDRHLDLGRRILVPEIMDSPGLSRGEHENALRALGRVNALSRTPHRFWDEIRGLASSNHGRPLRVLDVACGGGDVAIALSRLARRSGFELAVDGCDVSPIAVQHARSSAARLGCDARFFELDAVCSPLPAGYDVVCSSLFLHHLNDQQAVDLLREMSTSARLLVMIQDLIRSRTGYLLAYLATRALTRSQVVHVDAVRSVRASFTLKEAQSLTNRAGLRKAAIRRCWPERFSVVWRP